MADMPDKGCDKRGYLRHPTDIPVEIVDSTVRMKKSRQKMKDLSLGGLSFICAASVEEGQIIRFRIPLVDPVFEAEGRVARCRPDDEGGFSIGIEFLGMNEAFKGRMVEQVCQIELYRLELSLKRGHEVSGDEAAVEWIKKYASTFPQL